MRDGVGIARGMRHRHHAAIGSADADDRPRTEVKAQRLHVLDVLVERVFGGVAAGGAALTSMVEIDELHALGERRKGRLETAVVATGSAVNEESGRALAHARAVRDETGAIDVEIDLGISDLRPHGWLQGIAISDRGLV